MASHEADVVTGSKSVVVTLPLAAKAYWSTEQRGGALMSACCQPVGCEGTLLTHLYRRDPADGSFEQDASGRGQGVELAGPHDVR